MFKDGWHRNSGDHEKIHVPLIKGTIIQVIKREERLKRCLVSYHRSNRLNYKSSYKIQNSKFRVLSVKVGSLAEKVFQGRQGF